MLKEDKFKNENGTSFLERALCWDLRKSSVNTDKTINTTKISLSKSRDTRGSRSDCCDSGG